MAKEIENAVVEQPATIVADVKNDIDFVDVFANLCNDEANNVVKNAEVFSVRVGSRNKTYDMNNDEVNPQDLFLTIKLNKKVHAFYADESGEFIENITNQFQIGYYSFLGAINNSANSIVRRMASKIQRAVAANKFAVFEDFFVGATIDVVQQRVSEGDTYVNPFSNSANEQTIPHDMYISYISNIRPEEAVIAAMQAARAKSFDW